MVRNKASRLVTRALFILLLLLPACQPRATATVTPTAALTSTATAALTPTSTATLPATATSTFTPTPDPVIAEAFNFMVPILESVAGRSPDYEDDFSSIFSGWPIGEHPHAGSGVEEGVTGYEDGEYFIQASEAKFPQEGYPGQLITCQSASRPVAPAVLNFIMEVDTRFPDPGYMQGAWLTKFWHNAPYYFGIYLDAGGNISLDTDYPKEKLQGAKSLLRVNNLPLFDRNGGLNHIVVVARQSTLAVTVNGDVVVYVTDIPEHFRGPVVFGVCNNGLAPFRAYWDNLKIWHLPNQ